ncbi:hypothetical protein EVAR_101286_1 [Eumeta japonica]|uniref:Uncharacterized protein n=1 Tax=Eumeta variegata TaxID=151549 RepID=A0A4C1SIY2_EUMVA|nr:hypothetical protein EVAR_101286_1 [Eumeta japonica]
MTSRLQTRLTFIGALTNHVRTLVEESEREVPDPRIAGSFARYSRIDKTKTQLCAARAHISPRVQIQRELSNAKVKSHVRDPEMRVRATPWRKSNHPTKRFGQLPKRSKSDILSHLKPDNSVAIDDAEIAECLADSRDSMLSRFHQSASHQFIWDELPKFSPQHAQHNGNLTKALPEPDHLRLLS